MQPVLDLLRAIGPFTAECEKDLLSCIKKRTIKKGARLLEKGDVCRALYIVERGFLRGYYHRQRSVVTSWFAMEGDAVSSMYSFVTQRPSPENIEALDDCVLYGIVHRDLQWMYGKHPEFNAVGRIWTERYFIDLEERLWSMQSLTAAQRYQRLLRERPQILQRASLGHIASYLGISQETLSRIRSSVANH